ncbi:MAG: hypothetical protein QNK19_03355 [Xanthomonadales bacterium]|nr:hypothetical protein [Xanthomonadales bacterium]
MISLGRWQFDFSDPWTIALTLLLLASFLLVLHTVAKRLFRRAPLRALVVMALNTVAYATVFLLLLEPRFSHPVKQSVILLTEGAVTTGISPTNTARVYVAPGAATPDREQQGLNGANWLLDIAQLQLREPALSAIEIRGYGLEQDQWQIFSESIQVDFTPPDINGFTSMRWQRSLNEGETLLVSGQYQQADTETIVQLRLLDPAANIVDETRLKSGQGFSLATRVKARGNLAYRLQAWSSETLLSEQTVPLETGSGPRLNIMIKQSAPSFETRALKNYAAANGHRMRLNTDISKGKNISQSANLPTGADTTFSPQVLAKQDVLIMDGRTLTDSPATQRQWLSDAVENGLGFLLLADSTLLESISEFDTNLLDGFHFAPLSGNGAPVIPRLLKGYPNDWQAPLGTAAMQLHADDADVLIDDGHGRSLVVKRAKGLGNIGVSLISHSHNWLTAGQQSDWGDYWSALIASVARQRSGSYLVPQGEGHFYRVNQRAAVCAFMTDKESKVVIGTPTSQGQLSTFELQLASDRLGSPRQCVYFWPQVAGWHQLQLVSAGYDSILDRKAIYVFQADQWLTQKRDQRVRATRARAVNNNSSQPDTAQKWISEPLSLTWLWVTLVLSATLLWLERKLDFG